MAFSELGEPALSAEELRLLTAALPTDRSPLEEIEEKI